MARKKGSRKKKLVNIEPEEISLVDVPANQRKFLIVKNGEEFCCSNCGNRLGNNDLYCNQCGLPTVNLFKEDFIMLKEKLKNIIGEDKDIEKVESMNEDQVNNLKDTLEKVEKYYEDLPSDLKDASKDLIKNVLSQVDESDVEKSVNDILESEDSQGVQEITKKVSDDALKDLKEALKLLDKHKGELPDFLKTIIKNIKAYLQSGEYPGPTGYPYSSGKYPGPTKYPYSKEFEEKVDSLEKSVNEFEDLKKHMLSLKKVKEDLDSLFELKKSLNERDVLNKLDRIEELEKDIKSEEDGTLGKIVKDTKETVATVDNRLNKIEDQPDVKKSLESDDSGNSDGEIDVKWSSFFKAFEETN